MKAYPPQHVNDVLARLKSRDASQYYGAAFELYLYSFFTRLGLNPSIPTQLPGVSKPDFLLQSAGKPLCAVEATIYNGDNSSQRDEKLIDELFMMASQKVTVPGFGVDVRSYSSTSQSPSAAHLAKFLDKKFQDHIQRAHPQLTDDDEFEYEDFRSGWRIRMCLVPLNEDKHPKNVCVMRTSSGWPESHLRLEKILDNKRCQHSNLCIPLLIAIHWIDFSSMPDEDDILNALIGQHHTVVCPRSNITKQYREPNGLWSPMKNGSIRDDTRSILICEGCLPHNPGQEKMELWENPRYGSAPTLPNCPIARCYWDSLTGEFHRTTGRWLAVTGG